MKTETLDLPVATIRRQLQRGACAAFFRRVFVAAFATLAFSALRAQTPPAPWQSLDIGTTGAAGTTNYNSSTGQFTIEGAGDDIWGAGDQFRYVYQTVSGDFAIVAKVESVENTNPWAKAGVMIRETTGASAQYAFCFMTPSATNGGKWEYRSGTTSAGTTQFVPSPSLPHWVKVVRAGNTFTAFESANGTAWAQAGSAQTITMAPSVQIGLAVCSSVTGTLCTTVFSNVAVTNGLPAGWATADIGTVGLTGSASYAGGTFTVNGAGTEVYGTADSFRYAYQNITGDSTIIAKIATEQNSNQWAKVGVMYREDDPAHEPAARYVFLALTPDATTDRGFLFEYRATAGGSAAQNVNDATPPSPFAPYWLKLVRSGDTFSAFRSTDGSSWSAVGTPQAVALSATTRVGLAVCSHVPSPYGLNASTFTNVAVLNDTTAPTVAISAPSNGATVSGNAVAVSANASDDYSVASVQFKLDGVNLQAPDSASPYAITWDTTLVPSGSHALTAVATDVSGNPATSSAVTVTVSNSLPTGWAAGDVGTFSPAGSTNYSAGTWMIDGAGANIWNAADEFQFAHEAVSGDYTIIARVSGVENTNQWAKAGVMIRESLAADSKYAFAFMTPSTTNGGKFESRATTGGTATSAGQFANTALPRWLKLSRTANTFTAYQSSDGSTWTAIGTPQTIAMGASVYAGLAVCSVSPGNLCTATFDNVSVTAGGDGAAYNPAFPRLGLYGIGGDQNYPAVVWPILALHHVVIIGGGWESWGGSLSYTREDIVNGVHAASPPAVATKVFQYRDYNETKWADPSYPTWQTFLDSMNWWAWTTGTSGTHALSKYQPPNFWLINMTHAVPVSTGTYPGLYPLQWAAQFTYDQNIATTDGQGHLNKKAAPSLDGFYLDNVFHVPSQSNADWDRDGDTDSVADPAAIAATRQGYKDWFDKMRQLLPGKMEIGNSSGFHLVLNDDPNATPSAIAPLNGLLQGGLMEPALGSPAGSETSVGTAGMETRYQFQLDALAAPKLVIFEQANLNTDGSEMVHVSGDDHLPNADTTPYRAMRYGLACCLMKDGYYYAEGEVPNGSWDQIRWFDEFSVYQGVAQGVSAANVGAGMGYLGLPVAGSTGAIQTAARWHGVWAREFAGGLVLMNPKGNGSQTVTIAELGGSTLWKHISGTQGSVNNGLNVTADVHLDDRDGMILLRR